MNHLPKNTPKRELRQEGEQHQAQKVLPPAVCEPEALPQEKGKYGEGQPPYAPEPQDAGK